jgi:hypothetical protein
MYLKPPTKFYLYYYMGCRDYLRSGINTNFRTARELENNFYPQVGDLVNWTQEVSIRRPNSFYYNPVFHSPLRYGKQIVASNL